MKKKIMIVDDEMSNFGFLLDALEDHGYNVVTVGSGENAIKIAEETFYDVILMDFNLPGINGLEAFKRIKKVSPLSIVIMMTAAAPEAALNEAMAEGSFAVVYKPFKVNVMVDKINEALDKTTVIIVDDRFSDRELLKDLLEQKGCKCATVAEGEGAIEMLKHEKPNVIFIDITMPGMNGFEVLGKIKNIYPDLDVIMMTAYAKGEYLEMAHKMGALTCLYKPLEIDKILKMIDKIKNTPIDAKNYASIMLVEDDTNLNSTLTAILSENKYDVSPVTTGKQAIELGKAKFYAAAIVDFKLPDMSGIDVIKKLKDVNPNIIIILMSAYESLEMAMSAIREHVFDFLVKPVDPQVLLSSLQKGLRN